MKKKHCSMERDKANFHTGFDDKLKPRQSIDVSTKPDTDELLEQMANSAFGARRLGEAVDVSYNMFSDPDTFTVLTLSGAMTPAGMGLLICEMIERGFVQAIVSTGALMTHGFVESSGMTHFQYDPTMDDMELFEKGYNRIYDVIELEKNLDDVEAIVYEVLDQLDPSTILSSRLISHLLGSWLMHHTQGRGILKEAYKYSVPVYIPAFTDSELGLDVALYNRRQIVKDIKPFGFNPFFDLEHFTELINQQNKIGIFTIGGGVPRNWTQQVAPYLELVQDRMPKDKDYNTPQSMRYKYAVRICPDSVEWGGLSGCTYEEGKSWGKFEADCQTAEVLTDATMIWPILLQAVIQRLGKQNINRVHKNFSLPGQLETVSQLMKKYKLGS